MPLPRRAPRFAFAGLLLALLAMAAHGRQAAGTPEPAALAKQIDEHLKQLAAFGFSGSVLIAKEGQVLLEQGYGFADRAAARTMTADDAIYIGSVSKQFTAAAVLLLEREGLLRTEDTIDLHLRDVPPDKREITIHHLLTHTSGLIRDIPGDVHEMLTQDEAVARILRAPLQSPPGKQFSYSNAGYCTLAAIIARVTGAPFQDYLRENLFEPAHMASTCFLGDPQLERLRLATCYGESIPDGVSPRQWPATAKRFGPGGIVCTVGDLHRWDLALQGDALLTAAEKEKLYRPFKNGYAYGWSIGRAPDGSVRIDHNGGFIGISTCFNRYPDRHLTLIVFCNQEGLSPLITADLEAWLFGKPPQELPHVRPLAGQELQARAGLYQLPDGGRCRVRAGDCFEVTPEDAAATGALAGAPRVEDEVIAALAQKTRTLVESLGRLELGPWRELASDQLRSALSEKALQTEWRTAIAQHGDFQRCEVLGASVVPGASRVRVRSRSVMSRTPFCESYLWDQGRLVGIENDPTPPATYRFLPTSDVDFVWYDVFTRRSLSLRFTSKAGGPELHLQTAGGDLLLTRQSDER